MKAMLLLSGGIDSPVAGYQMARLGVHLEAVHFEMHGSQKVDRIRRHLEGITHQHIPLHIIPYTLLQQQVQDRCERRFQCVLCKRFMLRTAERLGREHGCDYLLTGESISQVASQTIDNMAVILKASTLPVLQPLLGADKQETIKIAREIGTYQLSTEEAPSCPYAPTHPATRSSVDRIEEQEALLPTTLVSELLGEATHA